MFDDIDIYEQFQIMIADLKFNPHEIAENKERSEQRDQ